MGDYRSQPDVGQELRALQRRVATLERALERALARIAALEA